LNQLRDQLHEVEQALGKGNQAGAGQDDQGVQQALGQVEQLRRQMEQLQAQLANRGSQQAGGRQNGQNGSQGQPGQQGQQGGQGQQQGGQQNQAGQRSPGGQSGASPQGAPGSPGGGQATGSDRYADGAGGLRDPHGPWRAGDPMAGPVRQEDLENSYRGALQSLGRLEQQLRDDPGTARDIQSLVRDLRNFDPLHFTDEPLLIQRIQDAVAGAEQVEMELRRKLDDASGGGSVRSPAGERVPQGYQDAVADYFRKLSKGK
jgi:hypothetical protein